MKPKYDTTVARMAGNIMPGLLARHSSVPAEVVKTLVCEAVMLARKIVDEVKRTEPAEGE